jgi:prefoldin subunit 5
MPPRTSEQLAGRLTELQAELQSLQKDFKDLSKRRTEIMKASKHRRDTGLLAAVKRQLGIK